MDLLKGWCLGSLLKNRVQCLKEEINHHSCRKIKYSIPDGCAEGVHDGCVEGLVLGVTVEEQGAMFKRGDLSPILSKDQIIRT